MDLRFSTLEVVAVILSVLLARMVAEDGESNWLEGLMLLMVYAILALAFFFLPWPPHGREESPAAAHATAESSPPRIAGWMSGAPACRRA
jgi:Ca2+:H+ antiporter